MTLLKHMTATPCEMSHACNMCHCIILHVWCVAGKCCTAKTARKSTAVTTANNTAAENKTVSKSTAGKTAGKCNARKIGDNKTAVDQNCENTTAEESVAEEGADESAACKFTVGMVNAGKPKHRRRSAGDARLMSPPRVHLTASAESLTTPVRQRAGMRQLAPAGQFQCIFSAGFNDIQKKVRERVSITCRSFV